MARTATELGANTFQFFPRNPRGGAAKPLAKEDIRQLEEWMDTHGFGEILCHGAYTMNGASTKEEVRDCYQGRSGKGVPSAAVSL